VTGNKTNLRGGYYGSIFASHFGLMVTWFIVFLNPKSFEKSPIMGKVIVFIKKCKLAFNPMGQKLMQRKFLSYL